MSREKRPKRLVGEKFSSTVQMAIDANDISINDIDIFPKGHACLILPIDNITIHLHDGDTVMFLGSECPHEYVVKWKEDVGGIIMRDYKKGNTDCYRELVVGDTTKCLVKRIPSEEVQTYQKNGFNLVTVADTYYCIIKAVPVSKQYSDNTPYFETIVEIQEVEENTDINSEFDSEDGMIFADLGINDDDYDGID